jgi:hypothetical protein
MLIGRWGVFLRSLRTTVDKAGQIVLLCMKLHNFVLDGGDMGIPPPCAADTASQTHDPDYEVPEKDQADTQEALHLRRRDIESSALRAELKAEIKYLELVRPALF